MSDPTQAPRAGEVEAIIPLGTETPWGRISGVGNGGMLGERYYWITDTTGAVAMIPHADVADALTPAGER